LNLSKLILSYKLDQGKVNLLAEKYGAKSEQAWKERVDTNNRFKQKLLDPITIASFVPSYNAVSRVTQEVKTIDQNQKTYSFTRDDEDQIVTATYPNNTSYAWTYDERNNRTAQRTITTSTDITETYIYNKADQLVSMEKRNTSNQQLLESFSYTYDNLGQMVTKTKTSSNPNEVTEYEYYVGGNLKQVTLPDESEIAFLYDAYGNRIQKATPEEVITYQYAMGSLRREIHKDDTNTTTIYALNYYPWGFDKVIPAQGENPEVVTPYYYVYDQKGFIQAIMDSDGDILESYEYSPFGELLTTPTITQFRFLSGREECIWDPEINLYYMHARYYDPILSRFQTQDSMRGSIGSPVSLNRYTYCQNDPISLADPSGNSPFNTGLPERFSEPGDQLKVDLQAACNSEVYRGDESDLSVQNNACNETYIIHVDAASGNGSFQITLPNGVVVEITIHIGSNNLFLIDPSEVKIKVISGETDANKNQTDSFITGLRLGLSSLIRSGVNIAELRIAANNASKMTLEDYNKFCDITNGHYGRRPTNSPGSLQASDFMRHAVIGGYIATKMKNYGYKDESTANIYIGLWVSYWTERYFYSSGGKHQIPLFSQNGEMGLIDIANFVKVLAHAEHGDVDGNRSPGIFGYDDYLNIKTDIDATGRNFDDYKGKENLFKNIGYGIGVLFNKVQVSTPGFSKPLNLFDWLVAARAYNGDGSVPGEETYNHCQRLMIYFRILYGIKIKDSSPWNEYLNKFGLKLEELYIKRKPYIDAGLTDKEIQKKVPSSSVFYP
jgi:RHS repeat-associated protein